MVKIEEITIIIPVYNCEKYIEKCLKSAIEQTYNKIKIVIINDGSTDKTIYIIKKLMSISNRDIKLYCTQNQGIAKTRNLGISLCDTNYFMFVDADDYLEKQAVEKLYNRLVKENCDMVIGSIDDFLENEIFLNEENKYDFLFNYKVKYFETPWNKLYKKAIFNDLKYPELDLAEDEYLFHHILKKCKKIIIIPDKTYNYTNNSEGLTAKNAIYIKDRIYAMKNKKNFFKNTKYEEIATKQYMNFLIYLYCEKNQKNMDKQCKKEILKLYKNEKWTINFKYSFFGFFPLIYCLLKKIK